MSKKKEDRSLDECVGCRALILALAARNAEVRQLRHVMNAAVRTTQEYADKIEEMAFQTQKESLTREIRRKLEIERKLKDEAEVKKT